MAASSKEAQAQVAQRVRAHLERRPQLLFFYSSSCALCRALEPEVADVGTRVPVSPICADADQVWAAELLVYGVERVPCLVVLDAADFLANSSFARRSTPDSVWKNVLTPEEYRILREKGTERAGTGEYNKHYEDGTYVCAGCGTPLYKSETKFDSGCGWPAFYEEIPGALDRHVDTSHGMKRVEITCAKCGGHMGHVFEGEGFKAPTDARHCVNSKALKFKAKAAADAAAAAAEAP